VLIVGGVATTVSYQAGSSARTAAEVASGLAQQIDGLGLFAASADGDRVVVVNPAGSAFTIGNFATTDTTSASTTRVSFGGAVVSGATWTLTVNGQSLSRGAEASGLLAAGFAAQINTSAALADFTALLDGDDLLIVKRSAGNFTTTAVASASASVSTGTPVAGSASAFGIRLSGAPRSGDLWSVRIDWTGSPGVTVQVTVGATVDGVVVDTLGEIAEALAAAVRGSIPLAEFTAVAKGDTLTLIRKAGGSFQPVLGGVTGADPGGRRLAGRLHPGPERHSGERRPLAGPGRLRQPVLGHGRRPG
jgi:hypothetical protein